MREISVAAWSPDRTTWPELRKITDFILWPNVRSISVPLALAELMRRLMGALMAGDIGGVGDEIVAIMFSLT